jgi:glycosyltransferase involved in cell wall biosynthesis
MKRFLKLVINPFENENRDLRELAIVREMGHEIIVIAKGEINEITTVEGFTVHRRTTCFLGSRKFKFLIAINRILSVITWAYYVRKFKADCISCHDIHAVFIGWISTWFLKKKKKPLLVYDSHEFEIGRNTSGQRGTIVKLIITYLERFLIKRCALSIMVNDSIADEVQRIHKLKVRPIVVRNIPSYWYIDEKVCQKQRAEFCRAFNASEDTLVAMYHGFICKNRGIEIYIKAIAKSKNTVGVVLGYGEEDYIQSLKDLTTYYKITEKIMFYPAVPRESLWQYVGAVDVGIVLIENTCLSYYYSLPNKLFENIQSETPIIGSNFPEISRIITDYNIGLCCDPNNPDEIAKALDKIRKDKRLYADFKRNAKKAKSQLNWETEKEILRMEYSKLL